MVDTSDSVFLTKTGERDTSATMQRILDEMSGGTDPNAPPMPPPAQPGEPGQPSQPDAPAGTAKAGVNAPQHLSDLDTPEKFKAFWTGFAPKVLKDVGYGVAAEGVPQAIEGGFDYMRHAGQAVGEFGDWLDKHVPFLTGGATPEELQLQKDNREKLKQLTGGTEFSLHNITGGGLGGQPTTTTGGLIRGISEFFSGYSGPLGLLKAGKIPEFLASPGAAGISMFLGTDPTKPNLTSMLVSQFPSLQGPVSDVLATNAADGPALNRLRTAAEGVAGTMAAELIVKGITAVGRFTKATEVPPGGPPSGPPGAAAVQPGVPPAAAPAADAQTQQAQSLVDAVAGKPQPGPAVEVKVGPEAAPAAPPLPGEEAIGVPGQVTGKAVTEATQAQTLADIRTNVNWDNIEKGNLNGVIGEVASEMKGRISEAKRGTIALETQKQMADALGMTPEDLIARQTGQALNSEQIIAAGQVMQASDERLLQLATQAQLPNAGAVDAMKVNEALITHMALIEQFLGASGEAGRALGALRTVHQMGTLSRARGLQMLLEQNGGEKGMKRLSKMIVDLNAAGQPAGAVNAALSRSWWRWSKDAIQEATAMGYLWRPTTHVRNIVGNAAMAIQQGMERSAAEKFGVMLGQDATVAPGEAMAYVRGQLSSFGEAFRTAGKAFVTGERQFEPLLTGSPIEQAMSRGISAASVAQQRRLSAVAAQAFTESPFGKAIDFIGGVQRLPGRGLQAADDFFKVIGYSGEIEAQAHRAAMAQGLVGKDYADAVAQMISNPPENVKLAAVDHALYATFNNNPGEFASDIMRARNNMLPMYIAMPYIRTPTNLFRVAMEHSPIAPALDQWRADIAAGGAPQALALAKMTTGSAAMSLLYDFAHNGHLTGPMRGERAYNEAQQGMGLRPMSVRIGKTNVEISGLGQLAPMIAFAGAVNEMMANKDIHPEGFDTVDEWTATVGSIIAYSTSDQSYLQGLSKLFGAINDGSKTGASAAMGAYIRDLASGQMNLIPGVALARSVGHAMDPQQRQIGSFMDALLYKDIPGLSDRLIPMRDVFGHEIAQQPAGKGGQLYNYVSPFRLSWQNDHPAFNEMVRLHTGIDRIAWKAPFQNVNVNFRDHPEVLDYYRRLAGNELKYNPKTGEKIGFEDFINRVISGKDPIYSQIYKTRSDPGETGVDSGKALFIKEWAQTYRQSAQKQIMSEAKTRFPDFYDEIKKGQVHRETQKLPTYLQGQGIEQGQQAVSAAMERPVQDPLPDRFGKPSVVPRRNPTAGGGFAVPSQ